MTKVMAAREPEVKLFGKNISMHENGRSTVMIASGQSSGEGGDSSSTAGDSPAYDGKIYDEGDVVDEDELENNMDCPAGDSCENAPEGKDQNSSPDKSESSESDKNSESSQVNDDSESGEESKNGKDKGDGINSEQKTLKKPDKILPCPRCNSMDTKFCYYNNYNVNQPRHFCKSCQRYWTAGGTMRNVPVGAGRRKNKNSSSHSHHITISEALEANIKPNGTVLSFGGHDSPLCESMAPNGYFKLEQGIQSPGRVGENVDDCSSGSTVTTSSSMVNENGFPSWPYPMQFYHSGYPMQFYPPPPYWNCGIPGPWSYPWMAAMSPASNQKSSGSDPNTPTLGKRLNDGELERKQSPEKKRCEGSVLVPKTLRIDDPDEAAKSSIWTTLGIKYDSTNKGSIFNAFQSKPVNHVTMPSSVLQANPAALTRSLSFREKA